MKPKNKEMKMDATRLTFGTIKIQSKDHSLTLGLSLPFFKAEQLNGQMVPEEWEDIIAEATWEYWGLLSCFLFM